jgi:hypothetical protein
MPINIDKFTMFTPAQRYRFLNEMNIAGFSERLACFHYRWQQLAKALTSNSNRDAGVELITRLGLV